MNILERLGLQVDIEKENGLLEDLSLAIPYFINKGLKDGMEIGDDVNDAKNPALFKSIWNTIKDLQETYGTDDTVFVARETPEGGRARSLTFGVVNGTVRCLDSATIKKGKV